MTDFDTRTWPVFTSFCLYKSMRGSLPPIMCIVHVGCMCVLCLKCCIWHIVFLYYLCVYVYCNNLYELARLLLATKDQILSVLLPHSTNCNHVIIVLVLLFNSFSAASTLPMPDVCSYTYRTERVPPRMPAPPRTSAPPRIFQPITHLMSQVSVMMVE